MSNVPNLSNLSLLDACLGYLIKHPEIDRTPLPRDLHDHLAARLTDPTYRIKPPYNRQYEHEVSETIRNFLNQFSDKETSIEQAQLAIEMFTYICNHTHFVRYNRRFSHVVQKKLIEFAFHNRTARPFFQEWQQFHRRFFGKPLSQSPPQYSYGVTRLNLIDTDPHSSVRGPLDHTLPSMADDYIIIRPLAESDGEAMIAMTHQFDRDEFPPHFPLPRTQMEMTHLIQVSRQRRHYGKAGIFVIIQVATHKLIGLIELGELDRDDSRGRVGYWIDPTIQEQDLGYRALQLFCSRSQESLDLERLEILIDSTNALTQAMVEQAGFLKEGTLRHYRRAREGYQDAIIYARLRHCESDDDDEPGI
jgi:RimJ/RimL family protein N-acetyltransferase